MEPSSGRSLLNEVERLRDWDRSLGDAPRHGEWECDDPHWGALLAVFESFLEARAPTTWTTEEVAAVLYAMARDDECQTLASMLGDHSSALMLLAEAALGSGDVQARWQIADRLGRLERADPRAEALVLRFAEDDDEYVRRLALQSLARLGSPATERVAIRCWSRPGEHRPWARMMALWALHRIGSPRLERLLVEAERDPNPYLSDYATRVRAGRVDP